MDFGKQHKNKAENRKELTSACAFILYQGQAQGKNLDSHYQVGNKPDKYRFKMNQKFLNQEELPSEASNSLFPDSFAQTFGSLLAWLWPDKGFVSGSHHNSQETDVSGSCETYKIIF